MPPLLLAIDTTVHSLCAPDNSSIPNGVNFAELFTEAICVWVMETIVKQFFCAEKFNEVKNDSIKHLRLLLG